MASAEFWYEFASTYSYPAALRVAALAERRCVSLIWRPFLLGPIFMPHKAGATRRSTSTRPRVATCGATSSGPAKRWAFRSNGPSPFRSRACSPHELRSCSKATSALSFPEKSLSPNSVKACRSAIGRRSAPCWRHAASIRAATFERAESDANKARLKAECARAAEIGVIGAPCLVTADGEVFWGNDRLEQGLDWAAGARIGAV